MTTKAIGPVGPNGRMQRRDWCYWPKRPWAQARSRYRPRNRRERRAAERSKEKAN
jgi:hypothetical protein